MTSQLEIEQFILQQRIKALKIRQKAASVGLKAATHNGDYFRRKADERRTAVHERKKLCWQAETTAATEELREAEAELQAIDESSDSPTWPASTAIGLP